MLNRKPNDSYQVIIIGIISCNFLSTYDAPRCNDELLQM